MQFWIKSGFLFFLVPYILLYCVTAQNGLFWDTIQFGSDHPSWYYNNNFKYFFLPDEIDSGHPPVFGMYLAVAWQLFGKSLLVSHTAMLPFIFIMVAQAVQLGKNLFPANQAYAFFCTAVVLSETALLSQCSLISPDIPVAAFFLWAWNSIITRKSMSLGFAVLLLGISSMRGMMTAFCLYFFSLCLYSRELMKPIAIKKLIIWLWQKALPFIPGGLVSGGFLLAHYMYKGWTGHPPPSSSWGGGFDIVPLPQIAINIGKLFWRIIDLGKILTVVVFLIGAFSWLRKKNNVLVHDKASAQMARSLFLLVLVFFLVTALPLTPYQGLLTHRYFIPLYLSIGVAGVYFLCNSRFRYKKWLLAAMILVQLSGNFWNYPRSVSQGWDSTLAHLPFFGMRKDFQQYMKDNGILKQEVATAFTLCQSDSRIDLKGDTIPYKNFGQDSTRYVWYTNVSNSMNKTIGYYFKYYHVLKKERRGNVEMVLFERACCGKQRENY